MQPTDHDILIELRTLLKTALATQERHEARITRLERAMWIAIGSSGFLGAVASKVI